MVKKIAFMTLVSIVAIAPQAFAFGGGGGGKGGNGPVSGTFGDFTYSGTCNNGECSGMSSRETERSTSDSAPPSRSRA